MQWIHNVTWFPAILSFVAATIAYVFYPPLTEHPGFILAVVIIVYWGMTFFNFFGIKTSSLMSTIGVIIGTLIPGLFIIFLGFLWFFSPSPDQITMSTSAFFPNLADSGNLVFLGGLFLAFAGLEVSAGYAGEVKQPQKNYPRAILLGGLITFVIFMLGSLSIALVIPKAKISLVTGLIAAFKIFLTNYHLGWLLPILAFFLIIGALAEINSWIIGPIKGLYATSAHGNLPPIFQKRNKHNVPINLLIFQAIIVTISSACILFMPNLSSAYWLLSALSTQMYLSMYFLMFISAIRLRYTHPSVPRAYKIPHPKKGMWFVASLGIAASLFAFIIFYVPPKELHITNIGFYELYLICGFLLMAAIPISFHYFKKPEWKNNRIKTKDI